MLKNRISLSSMPTCYTQRSRGACTFEGRHNCIKGKRPPSLFVRFIPIRDGVRGGAGWATAPPDFCLTNSKIRFFFFAILTVFINFRPTSLEILTPALILITKHYGISKVFKAAAQRSALSEKDQSESCNSCNSK